MLTAHYVNIIPIKSICIGLTPKLVKYSIYIKKEDRSSIEMCWNCIATTYCPFNIYTLSDEVIAAVFAINSSASTAARMLGE